MSATQAVMCILKQINILVFACCTRSAAALEAGNVIVEMAVVKATYKEEGSAFDAMENDGEKRLAKRNEDDETSMNKIRRPSSAR